MPTCAIFDTSGQLTQVPISDVSHCTGVILMSASDYSYVMSQSHMLIQNSADAESIAAGFIGLLAVAFCYRAVARVISQSYEGNQDEPH